MGNGAALRASVLAPILDSTKFAGRHLAGGPAGRDGRATFLPDSVRVPDDPTAAGRTLPTTAFRTEWGRIYKHRGETGQPPPP